MATGGNLATIEVSTDGTDDSWKGVGCTFTIPDVDWGTESANKEYCINEKNPIITVGNTEFGSNTVQYAWSQGALNEGNKILKDAKDAENENAKKVYIRVTINNAETTDGHGTQYVTQNMVTGYKHTGFTKDGSVKTEVAMEQLAAPEEIAAT